MKLLTTCVVSLLMNAGAMAQTVTATAPAQTPAQPATNAATMQPKAMTEAEVRKIDKDAKKITLKHGPIKNLDMPGMTMVFQVKDLALIEKLAVGDKIMFTAEQLQGAFVMTSSEKVAPK